MLEVLVAVTTFIATNIDEMFILVAFFAEPRMRAYDIVLGLYLGIGALVVVSIALGLFALFIPAAYVGFLGLVPIALGVKELLDNDSDDLEESPDRPGRSAVLTVTAVTIANGGDNLAIYTLLFSTRSGTALLFMIAVFAVMTGVWCAFAHWLVHHRTIGIPIRRYGQRVLPWVLIGLGVWIMADAGLFYALLG